MPLSSATASNLLHALGLAVQQAGMYGSGHNVARLAIREAAAALLAVPGSERGIEIARAHGGGGAIVCGVAVPEPDVAGRAFLARMEANGAQAFRFAPAVSAADAEAFLRLFAEARPPRPGGSGRLKAALEKAFPGGEIRVAESRWREVGGDARPSSGGALDLSGAMEGGAFDLSVALAAEPRPEEGAGPPPLPPRAPAAESKISEMLRRTADLLDAAGRPPDAAVQREVFATVESMLRFVEDGADGTARRIGALSRQIEADRAAVESLEAASRRRGMGPQVTRRELLARLAELNQEVVQPLTVSTGAIDLIRSGKGGDLTEEQKTLLHLAAESLDRLRQIVESIGRLSGLPEGLAPDAEFLR